MKTTLSDCLSLPVFADAKVLAGEDMTDRPIRYISVLEAAGVDDIDTEGDNPGTLEGYMLVTGFYGIRDDEKAQCQLAEKLADPGNTQMQRGSKVFPAGRFGVGMGVRITDWLHFNLEVNANVLGDAFNSKKGSYVDWQLGALAGLTFRIGKLRKESPAEPEPVEVVPVAAEEPQPQPAPEPVPAAVAVAEAGPVQETGTLDFAPVESSVYFAIGSSELSDEARGKISVVASLLVSNPGTRVTVTGHADRETGTAERNMELSRNRAENVAEALIAAGIEADRITVAYKGDTENVSPVPEENRVAICIVDALD